MTVRSFPLALIRFYQRAVSPTLGAHGNCRFTPSCSEYAHEAIERYGIVRGGTMAVFRILRCQPFSRGGYDPVPEKSFSKNNSF